MWIDWHLDENTVISDGPIEPIFIGDDINWYMHSKQGVFLISHLASPPYNSNDEIEFDVMFDPSEGDIKFIMK